MAAQKPSPPEDSIQSLVGDWWLEDDEKPALCRGRLLWAFVPHVSQEPRTLAPEGRSEDRQHGQAVYRMEPLRAGQRPTGPRLPVAGLPAAPGEVHVVLRAKRRPALVLGGEATDPVDPALVRGMSRWQSAQTVLVAPYYGADQDGNRGGFNPEFLERVRRAEYPEYMADWLPIRGPRESLLKFNHAQPIGRHYNSYELTPYRLSPAALDVVTDWFHWLLTGTLNAKRDLWDARELLTGLDP